MLYKSMSALHFNAISSKLVMFQPNYTKWYERVKFLTLYTFQLLKEKSYEGGVEIFQAHKSDRLLLNCPMPIFMQNER